MPCGVADWCFAESQRPQVTEPKQRRKGHRGGKFRSKRKNRDSNLVEDRCVNPPAAEPPPTLPHLLPQPGSDPETGPATGPETDTEAQHRIEKRRSYRSRRRFAAKRHNQLATEQLSLHSTYVEFVRFCPNITTVTCPFCTSHLWGCSRSHVCAVAC